MCAGIQDLFPDAKILYGGSVAGNNIAQFLAQPCISGVLVGNRSCERSDKDANFFQNIVRGASQIE